MNSQNRSQYLNISRSFDISSFTFLLPAMALVMSQPVKQWIPISGNGPNGNLKIYFMSTDLIWAYLRYLGKKIFGSLKRNDFGIDFAPFDFVHVGECAQFHLLYRIKKPRQNADNMSLLTFSLAIIPVEIDRRG